MCNRSERWRRNSFFCGVENGRERETDRQRERTNRKKAILEGEKKGISKREGISKRARERCFWGLASGFPFKSKWPNLS